jgi:hypothetical protein
MGFFRINRLISFVFKSIRFICLAMRRKITAMQFAVLAGGPIGHLHDSLCKQQRWCSYWHLSKTLVCLSTVFVFVCLSVSPFICARKTARLNINV